VKVEASSGTGAVYNNHYYEATSTATSWTTARSNAAALTVASSTGGTCAGYLATITSQGENDFILTRVPSDAWIGATDDTTYTGSYAGNGEGQWFWVTGPEAGTKFMTANLRTSVVAGQYAYWANGEPNDWGSGEDYAEFYSSNSGLWNDLPNSSTLVSVVEYGTSSCIPAAAAAATSQSFTATSVNPVTVSTYGAPTGTKYVGSTLTSANTFAAGSTVTVSGYEWQRSSQSSGGTWTAISGANSSTYVLTNDDIGKYIRVLSTGTSSINSVTATSVATTQITIPTPSTPSLASASDTGTSNSDKVTNDNTPTLSLTGLTTGTNVTVTATKAGATNVVATIDAVDATSKSITLPTLSDGTWAVTVTESLNGQSATSSQLTNLVIDTVGPQVTDINFIPTLTKLNTVTVEVTFNESILNSAGTLSQDAIELGGITSGWTAGVPTRKLSDDKVAVFTLTRTGNTIINGTLTLDALAGLARDQFDQESSASSAGLRASGKFDQNRPTATWSTLPPALTNQSSISATLEFSEPIRNLASSDFLFSGASTNCVASPAASSIASNASSPYRMVVTISGCSAQGEITLKLSSDAVEDYTDTLGNTGPDISLMPTATFTRDTVAPTIESITKTFDGVDVDYEYVFSEPVTGLTSANITVSHTVGGNAAGWAKSTPTLKTEPRQPTDSRCLTRPELRVTCHSLSTLLM
jgi:hypothetical protein